MPGVFRIEGLSALGLKIWFARGTASGLGFEPWILDAGSWLTALAEKNPTDSSPDAGCGTGGACGWGIALFEAALG